MNKTQGRWQQHSQPCCYIPSVLIFPHSGVTRGEGLYFLHPWVSTFIVCHTTFLGAPHPFPSQGPFKDIILYENTQLLSDGNAPWLWLSGCLGNSRRDVSQVFRRAEQIQPTDWWTRWWPGVTFKLILNGFVLGEPVLSLLSHLPLIPGGEVITWLT